ncbi:hypothetical protein [Mycobacterium sp.]|uniref:hypothetical protein n=1 Tax=Mycobacterium sp. TaxID=1785 RepID=UPI003D6A5A0C
MFDSVSTQQPWCCAVGFEQARQRICGGADRIGACGGILAGQLRFDRDERANQ